MNHEISRENLTPKPNRQKWWRRAFLILPAILLILSGGYLLTLTLAPQLAGPSSSIALNRPVSETKSLDENRFYVPKLKLNIPYNEGEEEVLQYGLWHRWPERGNPEQGGNFILVGHRFEMGLTPGQTVQRSPLYHIEKLELEDKIYVDFNGTRYQYTITKKYSVEPKAIYIEAPSTESKLTLYTCTLRGQADGRMVIEAKLTAVNIDPNTEL